MQEHSLPQGQQERRARRSPQRNSGEQIVLQRILTSEVKSHIGERVLLSGWLHSWREMGGVSFLVLRDAWGTLQAVAETAEELCPLREQQVGLESAISLTGRVVAMAQAPGGVELHELHIEVITPALDVPVVPLNKPKLSAQIGTLLDHAVVANRHPTRRAILRLGAGAMQAFRAVLDEQHFTEIQTPKIVAGATESGASVFEVNYFGRPAYLAQSPQFYKQIMVGVFERVYEVGPVFRAERHDTTRHINEYVLSQHGVFFMAVLGGYHEGISLHQQSRYRNPAWIGMSIGPVRRTVIGGCRCLNVKHAHRWPLNSYANHASITEIKNRCDRDMHQVDQIAYRERRISSECRCLSPDVTPFELVSEKQ